MMLNIILLYLVLAIPLWTTIVSFYGSVGNIRNRTARRFAMVFLAPAYIGATIISYPIDILLCVLGASDYGSVGAATKDYIEALKSFPGDFKFAWYDD